MMNRQLLKYEFEYTNPFWIVLTGLLLAFTVFSLFDFQILTGPAFEIDYWGAIYSMFLYMFLYMMWIQKIKENRLRLQVLLPIPQKSLVKSMIGFYGIPLAALFLYVVVIHLTLLDNWKDESSTLLAQSGLFFAIFLATIIGRDLWITNNTRNIFKRILPITTIALLIISIIAIIMFMLPHLYKAVPDNWGRFTFLYSKVVFYLLAFLVLLALSPAFLKRSSYLS